METTLLVMLTVSCILNIVSAFEIRKLRDQLKDNTSTEATI